MRPPDVELDGLTSQQNTNSILFNKNLYSYPEFGLYSVISKRTPTKTLRYYIRFIQLTFRLWAIRSIALKQPCKIYYLLYLPK
jgi:hypothetical protein